MDYRNAIEQAITDVTNTEHPAAPVLRDALQLVLAGWRLPGADHAQWDLLGTAAGTVADDLQDLCGLPTMRFVAPTTTMGTGDWPATVRLVDVIANRLDAMAEQTVDSTTAWWAATSAARLRAALPRPT